MKRFGVAVRALMLVGCGVVLTGCAARLGPDGVRRDRANYNEEIVGSVNEELLLNVVRLRYRDRPLFMELKSIVSQRVLRGSLSGGAVIGIDGGPDNEGSVGGSVGFEERPTVTYGPLQGEEYARRLLTPITPETIILLSNSGWSIERLLLLCVSRLNGVLNAPSAAGPTPDTAPVFEDFHELAATLRRMQRSGLLSLQAFRDSEGAPPRVDIVLDIPSGATADGESVSAAKDLLERRLGLSAGQHVLRLTTALSTSRPGEIALNPRSLLGVLYFASQAVEVPEEHEERGLVTVTRTAEGAVFDWSRVTGDVFAVRTSRERPSGAFVAVPYRGHWFYVDDADLDSKATFNLLHLLFALTATDQGTVAPILTIPTG